MLDLSLYEVQAQPSVDLRLLAIVKTQDRLTLSFLYEGIDATYCANEHCPWLPGRFSRPAHFSHGWLRKNKHGKAEEHYFNVVPVLSKVFLLRVQRPTDQHMNFDLIVQLSSIPYLKVSVSTIQISATTSAGTKDLSSFDEIYLIPIPDGHEMGEPGFNGRGCRFQVAQEATDHIDVVFAGAVSYTASVEPEGAETTDSNAEDIYNGVPRYDAVSMEHKQEIRLECDWSQWPTLGYSRSTAARLMTSKQGPNHIYIIVIFFFEMVIGVTTFSMILFVFPNAEIFGGDFWFDATPAEWSIWGFCILAMLVRAYILLYLELPALNRLLKSIEYQKWTSSFGHTVEQNQAKVISSRALSFTYQYYSWYLIILLLAIGVALMTIGLTVDQPNLYDLSMLGGYLLFAVTVRMLTEMLWRYPGLQKHKVRFAKYWFADYREGSPSLGLTFPLGWLSKKRMAKFFREPNLLTHNTYSLSRTFEDPMYLPESYKRGG